MRSEAYKIAGRGAGRSAGKNFRIGSNVNQNTPPEILSDGNTIAFYDRTRPDGVVKDEAGRESIYWDLTYGSEQRGEEQASGNIVLNAVYEITACTTDFFYTGCQVGDIFPCGTVKTCSATNKVKRVLGNHATQPDITKQPINGVFNGVDDCMQTPDFSQTYNQPYSVFSTFKQYEHSASKIFFDLSKTGAVNIASTSSVDTINLNAGTPLGSNKFTLNKLALGRFRINGVSSEIQYNNLTPTIGDSGANTLSKLTIGSYRYTVTAFSKLYFEKIVIRSIIDESANDAVIANYLCSNFNLDYKKTNANLLIIAGQSNAIGYYDEDILPLAWKNNQAHIAINFYQKTGTQIEDMNPYVNAGYDWGAEQSAAHDIFDTTGKDVLLIKNGITSIGIEEWDDGATYWNQLETALLDAVPRITNKTSLSLLWMQGEHEAASGESTAYYEAKLRSLITRIRALHSDLSNIQIVFSKLSDLMLALNAANRLAINTAFSNVAADTTNVTVLDVDAITGLTIKADLLHYTAASLLLIGSAWADLIET